MDFKYNPKPTPEQARRLLSALAALIVASFVLAFAPNFVDTTTFKAAVGITTTIIIWFSLAVYIICSSAALGADEREEAARLLNAQYGLSLTSEDVRYLLSTKEPLRVSEGGALYEFFYDGQTITVEQSPTSRTTPA